MDHHVYNVALLQLAFYPGNAGDKKVKNALKIVAYPRGREQHRLSRDLYGRMIEQLLLTCHTNGVQSHEVRLIETRMKKYKKYFSKQNVTVGGINAPHILRRVHEEPPPVPTNADSQKEASNVRRGLVLSKLLTTGANADDSSTVSSSRASSCRDSSGSLFSLGSANSLSPVRSADSKKSRKNATWGWLRGKKTNSKIPSTVAA